MIYNGKVTTAKQRRKQRRLDEQKEIVRILEENLKREIEKLKTMEGNRYDNNN